MPVFNLTLPRAVKALLAAYPADTLVPGDVLITNDPWLGTGHLFDFVVVTPVFRKGQPVALFASTCHTIDVGGLGFSADASSVFEEGTCIPHLKLVRAGALNEDVLAIIQANSRNPIEARGDILSLVSSNEVGIGKAGMGGLSGVVGVRRHRQLNGACAGGKQARHVVFHVAALRHPAARVGVTPSVTSASGSRSVIAIAATSALRHASASSTAWSAGRTSIGASDGRSMRSAASATAGPVLRAIGSRMIWPSGSEGSDSRTSAACGSATRT
mgnify:CR=1 FL=1